MNNMIVILVLISERKGFYRFYHEFAEIYYQEQNKAKRNMDQ